MTSRHVPITDFIDQFHTSLCATAAAELQPRFKPEHRNQSQYVQHVFKQPLFPAQLDCSAALALRLSTHKDAIAVAEMSCGKTRMGVATSRLHHAKRALIVVPPHLVDKWQDEILAVLPNARVVILESISGVETAAQAPIDPDRPFFAIMSRERAKLSYARKPAIIPKTYKVEDRRLIRYVCPHCWTPVTDKEDIPLDPDTLSAGDKCTQCKSVLWTFDPEGPRRFALGDFICRQFPFKFDLLIGDELHTLEGKGSAQGLVFANLIGKTKKVVGLTGTLSNGKSTSLFYLLWRLVPDLREMFPYHADKQWIDTFGVWEERTTTLDTDTVIEHGKQSRRRVYVTVRERPGISPALIPYLIERCIFMKMEDLGLALPPYREQVLPIQFNDALAANYGELRNKAKELIRKARKSRDGHLLSITIQSLLAYPDRCMIAPEVITDKFGDVLFELPALPSEIIYPKEQELLDHIAINVKAGFRTMVYCTHTETRDITGRLASIIQRAGYRATVMKASISARRRMGWLREQRKRGLDVMICQPQLVELGLDLLEYERIFWFEPEYKINTVRQASRRSWRIGQTNDILVSASFYASSFQQQAWALIARGMQAALHTEGDLVSHAISVFEQEDDLTLALIKFLLDKNPEILSAERAFQELHATTRAYAETVDDGPIPAALPAPTISTESTSVTSPKQAEAAQAVRQAVDQLSLFAA